MKKENVISARKKRCDRTHAIYEICVSGQRYIGITAKTQSTVLKSVKLRIAKHLERARNENKPWPLYEALRNCNPDEISWNIVKTVRGRANAHTIEVMIIKSTHPELNLASAVNE
jgi:hypothetical protein